MPLAVIKSTQIRGSLTEVIPSQDVAVMPEGVETRRVDIQCKVCMTLKSDEEFYVKDRATGRRDCICKQCRIIKTRERNLGVTQADYMRMHTEQKGKCGICLKRLRSRRFKAFAVDHCHETGRIRGLLCGNCNTAIGLLRDSVDSLQRAIHWVKV